MKSGGSAERPDCYPSGALNSDPRVSRLLFGLFGAIFAGAAGTHALTPIFPELKAALGVGDGEVRLLTSSFTVGYAISGFVLGVACDRIGRRRVLLPSLAVYAVACGIGAVEPTTLGYGGLLAARWLAGLATGGISAAVLSMVSDAVPFQRRGRAMSFVLSGSYAAVVLGIPLAATMARFQLTAFLGVLGVVALVTLVVVAREAPRDRVTPSTGSPFTLPWRALARPGAKGALATTALNTFAAFAVLTSLADHTVDAFGAGLTDRTVLFLGLGLAALPGALVASLLSDRLGKRRSVVFALIGSLILTPLLLVPESFGTFMVAAALVSLVQAVRQGPFAAILTELVPASLRGSLVGLNSAASGFGLALGTWAGGLAYAAGGLHGDVGLGLVALAGSTVLFTRCVPRLEEIVETGEADKGIENDGPSGRQEESERSLS